MYDDCPQVLRDFLFYMQTIKGRSIRSVEGYALDLKNFLKFMRHKKENIPFEKSMSEIDIMCVNIDFVKKITLSDAYEYLTFAMVEKKNQAKTRARKVTSLRSFFKYLTNTSHQLEDNPLKELETPAVRKSLPKYLSLEESLELLQYANSQGSSRDYCIFVLFLNCGMRLSELVQINLADIKNNTLKILGKGNKERIVHLNPSCLNALEAYLHERSQYNPKETDKQALFLSQQGKRITPRRVEQIVENYVKKTVENPQGISPHKLRHTAATLLYQHANVDVRILQELLGHVSIATTEIYTHTSSKQLEDAVNKSPLAGVKHTNKKDSTET